MFIWANTLKDILNGDAGNDDLNKYYLNLYLEIDRFEKENINYKIL